MRIVYALSQKESARCILRRMWPLDTSHV